MDMDQINHSTAENISKAVVTSRKNPPERVASSSSLKVIQWEDFEHELARLLSLSSALNEVKQKKLLLHQKLDSLTQVNGESISRSNELDEMREKLEYRKLLMGNMSMHSKIIQENVKSEKDRISSEIRSLVVAGSALSVASKGLQESTRSLSGEGGGYANLRSLLKLLRVRQQYMISQVSLLYPVKVVIGHTREQELESFRSNRGSSGEAKGIDEGSITISGLYLTMQPFKKMSLFTDKKEVQRTSTALGYIAHAVFLIGSYLQVPLRYPLQLGGSRSYIHDHASSSSVDEPTPSDSAAAASSSSSSLLSSVSSLKPAEFPLFLDSQDTTRAAYAMFLLNKDIEQLLNFIGKRSLGPRHVLGNLKELLRTILSPEYIVNT
ncbi:UV radiation resistance-associated gene protein [Impatiens glandulifera]|uniref:UV radiation resistance-associated gene protein n=1 Tax=Impatiens glandulifera TaxID=253017 RepID=UPI001FB0D4F4|nr:UV radiation resistance-associated gene protein [Impatiens glandulifera]